MATPVRAIFFDAGNTLLFPRLDELAAELVALGTPAEVEDFQAAEREGKKKLDEWLWPKIESRELPPGVDRFYWAEYLRALLGRLRVPPGQRDSIARHVMQRFRDIRFWSHVFPETEPVLRTLRASGYLLGVISNSVGTMEEQLGRLGLAPYFPFVFDSAIVGVEKPHPEIFQLAFERAGVSPAEVAFVGDTYATDMGGARLANCRGILLDRVGAYADAKLDCPIVKSLAEINQVLER